MRLTVATHGGIDYEYALNMNWVEKKIIMDELNNIERESNRK